MDAAYHARHAWPDLQDLLTISEAVEDVQTHGGWLAVEKVLDMCVAELDADVNSRREPMTQAEYAMAHGRRHGLQAMREAAHAIVAYAEVQRAAALEGNERAAESAQRSR
jgi:hypothetical protein